MLVAPLVSKSSGCVIRLSQWGEVCTSGISSHLVKAIHSKFIYLKRSLKELSMLHNKSITQSFQDNIQFSLIYQLTVKSRPPPVTSKTPKSCCSLFRIFAVCSLQDHVIVNMPNKGSDRYPEMDWRAVDPQVAEWRLFKKKMTIYGIADGTPKVAAWMPKFLLQEEDEAIIFIADHSRPRWKPRRRTLSKDIECLLGTPFEKSFEQATKPLALSLISIFSDFRQEPDESNS